MKRNLERTIELPEGVTVVVHDNEITVRAKSNELKKSFMASKITLTANETSIKLQAKGATRRESRMIGTLSAHIKNMIKGVTEGFEYELEICNVHFPMNVKVEGDLVVIKSFLGEKMQRTAAIKKDVTVAVNGSQVIVKSSNIESAGQTAANIEKATRLVGRDRRIFQDGIFIVKKNGRSI